MQSPAPCWNFGCWRRWQPSPWSAGACCWVQLVRSADWSICYSHSLSRPRRCPRFGNPSGSWRRNRWSVRCRSTRRRCTWLPRNAVCRACTRGSHNPSPPNNRRCPRTPDSFRRSRCRFQCRSRCRRCSSWLGMSPSSRPLCRSRRWSRSVGRSRSVRTRYCRHNLRPFRLGFRCRRCTTVDDTSRSCTASDRSRRLRCNSCRSRRADKRLRNPHRTRFDS